MLNLFWKKNYLPFLLLIFTLSFSNTSTASELTYKSNFINQSNQTATKYTLVKTRIWPENNCVIESGQAIVLPGEHTNLVIAKKKECSEAGIGYSLYKTADSKKKNLLGYVSHRFRDGKFSLQVSVFCEGQKCVFKDLNPTQRLKKLSK